MTQEALDPLDSAAILEALAAVSPGVDFAIEQAPADEEAAGAPAASAEAQPFVFGQDGRVYESDEPVWDEGRVVRPR